jgi:hypothetical protein
MGLTVGAAILTALGVTGASAPLTIVVGTVPLASGCVGLSMLRRPA